MRSSRRSAVTERPGSRNVAAPAGLAIPLAARSEPIQRYWGKETLGQALRRGQETREQWCFSQWNRDECVCMARPSFHQPSEAVPDAFVWARLPRAEKPDGRVTAASSVIAQIAHDGRRERSPDRMAERSDGDGANVEDEENTHTLCFRASSSVIKRHAVAWI